MFHISYYGFLPLNIFIGAISATIGANIEFIYDIIYDTKRFTMTLVLLSMTSNIGYAEL